MFHKLPLLSPFSASLIIILSFIARTTVCTQRDTAVLQPESSSPPTTANSLQVRRVTAAEPTDAVIAFPRQTLLTQMFHHPPAAVKQTASDHVTSSLPVCELSLNTVVNIFQKVYLSGCTQLLQPYKSSYTCAGFPHVIWNQRLTVLLEMEELVQQQQKKL